MKQHELLAVEANLETQATKTRTDLSNTFEKKRHLFEEKRINFTPLIEGQGSRKTELQLDLQSTVDEELKWVCGHIAKFWDASYRIAETNMVARADIVLEDGTPIAKSVPATFLLELQKRLSELLSLVQAVPTLDPAKGFKLDPDRGVGVFKAREVKKNRTTKQSKVIIKYEATKEHPAQTELVNVDVVVGEIEEQEWSGLLTPARKAELLDNIEKLSRAVRSARSRANEAEVNTNHTIANKLLNYVFSGGSNGSQNPIATSEAKAKV